MTKVTALCLAEPSAIDTAVVQEMKRVLGERRCRSVVDAAVFEITETLCAIERGGFAHDRDDMGNRIARLIELATQVGLVCMADVAADLLDCIEAGDAVAFSAVTGRLIRLGEDGLFALIDFTDRSIV